MARKAKDKGKTATYADMAKKTAEKPSFFANLECSLTLPPGMPNKRIPNTNEKHSFFVDLLAADVTEEEVANAVTFPGVIGFKYRPDLKVVEFVCEDEDTARTGGILTYEINGKF